jgi:hypothetical protein
MLVPINQKDMVEEAVFLLAKHGVRGRSAAMEARRRAQESLAKATFSDYMSKESQLAAQKAKYWIEKLPKLTQSEGSSIIMADGFTLWPMDHTLFLRFLAAMFLERGEPMPDGLRLWAIIELKSPHPQPRSPGPRLDQRKNVFRDAAILGTINTITSKYGVNPTRSREPGAVISACQVVAEALGQLRVNVSELGVERIWNSRPGSKTKPFPALDGIDSDKLFTWGMDPRYTKRR